MKSTTYIVEITNQKNEKYLYVGRNPVAWSSPRFLALCQLINFLHVFTEKCFAILDQSGRLRNLPHMVSATLIFLGIFFYHSFYGMTLRF